MEEKLGRLVVFGDSYTYGHGLPDCVEAVIHPGPFPSKMAWPSLVAEKLNVPCINNSICGLPNKKILLSMLNFPFEQNDLVITLWSFHHRGCILQDNGKYFPIRVNSEDNIIKSFYNVHSEYDLCVDALLNMHHASYYMKQQKINYYSFFFDPKINTYIQSNSKQQISIETHFLNLRKLKVDDAADGRHIGPLSHKIAAEYIFEKIKE